MARKAGSDCPNCGSALYDGWEDATGGILICRDNEGNGCQIAVDPNYTAAVGPGPWDVEAAPEVAPAPEAVTEEEPAVTE